MNKMMLMTGVDIPIPEIETVIHQPRIKEISYIGELEYFSSMQILCVDKETALKKQDNSDLSEVQNFQIFMALINNPNKDKNNAGMLNNLLSLFSILFPGYNAQLMPTGIYLNNAVTKHNFIINENNFNAIQLVCKAISGLTHGAGKDEFNPANAKAQEIAQKIMRGRQRVAKQQGNLSDNTDGILARYVSILTVGLNSMTLEDCLNLTIYQLYDLIDRYNLYLQWDLDIKSRLAGGSPDSKPDDWMKNIH